MQNKVVSLQEAIQEIQDGDTIFFGASWKIGARWRLFEIVRQQKRAWCF